MFEQKYVPTADTIKAVRRFGDLTQDKIIFFFSGKIKINFKLIFFILNYNYIVSMNLCRQFDINMAPK